MPFTFPFLQGQRQSKDPHEDKHHSNQLGNDPPPPALGNAPTSDVIFPNDDYPPGFPCLSGCGKKFPTVIQLEIHIQHYCEGPYHEIEAWQGASVAAPQPPSASSVSNHDRIIQWLASSSISSLEPNPPSSPSPAAIVVDHNEDFASDTSHLEPDPPAIPNYDAIAVDHDEDFALGTSHLEHPPSNPTGDAVAVNHNENFASGTSHLEPNPPSTPTVNAVAGNHTEGFKCTLCSKCLTRRGDLNRHMKVHTSGKLICPLNGCNYHTAKSQGELDFHVRVDHADVTEQRGGVRYTCWYCGRNMKRRPTLMYHVRLHESGKFPCPIDNCLSPVCWTQVALDQHLKNKHTDDQISGSFL